MRGVRSFPSPLAGEGGPARSGGPDEGFAVTQETPHPSPPATPAPAGEEGKGRAVLRARALRRAMTEPERKLWHLLRSRRFSGFKFRRQVPIGPYFADFICFEARLIVEADGGQHCDSAHDARRDAWLAAEGYRIRRFWNVEIMTRSGEVADTLWHDLNPTPHPSPSATPSPARGEGESAPGLVALSGATP